MNQLLQKSKKIIKMRAGVRAGSLLLGFKLLVIILLGFISENTSFSQIYLLNGASNGQTINTCFGKFYDSGGPGNNYNSNENYTLTFCSNNSFPIKFDFAVFDTRPSDILYVYDGPNTSSPLMGQFSGTPAVPFSVTSSGTCLTFKFVSGLLFNRPGWAANISTFDTSPISPGTTEYCAGTTVNYSVVNHVGSTYDWTVVGGTPSNLTDGPNNIDITWDLPGGITGLIKVVEINSCGGKDSSELFVDIFNIPAVDFSGLLSQAICISDNAVFSVSATGNNLTYQWQENDINITDGGIYSGTQTPTLTLTAPGITKNGKMYRCIVEGSCHAPFTSNEAILTVDTQAPIWTTIAGLLNRNLSCDDAPGLTAAQALFPVATDNTDSDVTDIIKTSGAFIPGLCPNSGSYTNTWTVADACGNVSAVYTQVITIADSQAPIVAGSITNTGIEGCNAGAAPAAKTTVAELEALPGGITINDNCTAKANLTVTSSTASAGTCPVVVTRTYTVKDQCGNSVNIIHTININDTQAPVVTGSLTPVTVSGCNVSDAPAAVTSVVALEALPGGVTINDACTAKANLTVVSSDVSAGTCPVVVTRTYTIKDQCGNSVNIIHKINVNDTQAPVVTGSLTPATVAGCNVSAAPAAVTSVAALEALPGGIIINDNCTAKANLTVTSITISAGTCPIVVTRTYTIKDQCGNSINIIHTINVNDTQAPVVIGSITTTNIEGCDAGAAPAAVSSVTALEALTGGITINDNCTTKSNLVVTSITASGGTCPVVVTRTYTVKDQCGNSVNIIHTININDTQAPVVVGSLTASTVEGCDAGAAPASVSSVAALEALPGGVTINDACTPKASLTVTSSDVSAGTCPIVITRTYTVKDQCGKSVNIIHKINVNDTQAPVVTGSLTPVTVVGCDVSVAPAAVTSVAALEAMPGSITINDACTADGSMIVTSNDIVSGTCPIVITRTYTINDGCGNSVALPHVITVNLNDNTSPAITGTIPVTDAEGCSASDAPAAVTTVSDLETMGLTISDVCTADANLVVTSSDVSSGTCPVVVTRTYNITDACGNTSSVTQTINVDDTTPPSITGCVDIAVNNDPGSCNAVVTWISPVVTDNCGLLSVVSTLNSGDVFSSGTTPVTYTATDNCGNVTTCTFNVVVTDNELPVITCPGSVSQNEDFGFSYASVVVPDAVISDNCSLSGLIWAMSGATTATSPASGINQIGTYNFNTGVTTVTYILSDAAGNFATCEFTVTIIHPLPLSGNITSQTNIDCFGDNTGSVTVTAIGGSTPYEYKIDAGAYQSSDTFIALSSGPHTVTIRDGYLNTFDVDVTITQPSAPLSVTTDKTDIACFGALNGSATATASGGTGPYSYSWNSLPVQNTPTASGLSSGTFTVSVTDSKGCPATADVTITQPVSAVTVTTSKVDATCFGGSNGSATAVAAGGSGPYNYSWSTAPVQNNATATALIAGTYTITVTESLGCTVTGTVQITEPSEISIAEVHQDESCPGVSDGSITLTISGGTQPYGVLWLDANPAQNRTDLTAGTYKVIVTDVNGCAKSLDIEIGVTGTFNCVLIPDIITPNNDGFNDKWVMKNIDLYPDAEVLVFNRWGELVFRTKNIPANPWDGTFKGKLVPTDSYHYILYLNDGSKPRSGVISVIR